MLTNDLLRFDIGEHFITPRYLKRKHSNIYLQIAGELLEIHEAHLGKTRAELEQALTDYESDRIGYKILRGLVKILDGFTEFQPPQEFDYPECRKALFEFVEEHRPVVVQPDLVHHEVRESVLAKFTSQYGPLPPNLYGDLPDQQILTQMQPGLRPENLVKRYNLALAQGVLYRCHTMAIKMWDGYKTIFHYLKLAQLIHKISKAGDAYVVEIDGPFSLFQRTQKYGVNLARFLPGLLLAEKWSMDALINTDKGRRHFVLDQDCGLTSYYQSAHPFDSTVEKAFYDNFSKRKTEWEIRREDAILDLGDTVLIPDFRLVHPDGREVLLEIVGFWTPEYLEKKLDKLNRTVEDNLIVAVNRNLNCSPEDFRGPVIFYNTRLKVKDVLSAIDSL